MLVKGATGLLEYKYEFKSMIHYIKCNEMMERHVTKTFAISIRIDNKILNG